MVGGAWDNAAGAVCGSGGCKLFLILKYIMEIVKVNRKEICRIRHFKIYFSYVHSALLGIEGGGGWKSTWFQ
jgi:hypothetical protein